MSSQPSLPEDPHLAEAARQIEATRNAAAIADHYGRLVWVSTELRALLLELSNEDDEAIGIGKTMIENYMSEAWSSMITEESQLRALHEFFPYHLWDMEGGKAEARALIKRCAEEHLDNGANLPAWVSQIPGETFDEMIDNLLDPLEPKEPPPVWTAYYDYIQGDLPPLRINEIHVRLYDLGGTFRGTLGFFDINLPARVHTLLARGDEHMYARMANLIDAGPRQAAVLFADLESSAALSRKLSSPAYFRLIRDLTTAIDELVGTKGGIVGKHAGDGVTAFFLADDVGSPSGAARAAIGAALEIVELPKRVAGDLAADIGEIEDELCRIKVGVHWGSRLYMGQLVTGGRLEVTALGDAVNECARIQEAARGGQVLASKNVIESLSAEDAHAISLDPERVLYSALGDIADVSDKVKRDAGGIPVASLA